VWMRRRDQQGKLELRLFLVSTAHQNGTVFGLANWLVDGAEVNLGLAVDTPKSQVTLHSVFEPGWWSSAHIFPGNARSRAWARSVKHCVLELHRQTVPMTNSIKPRN